MRLQNKNPDNKLNNSKRQLKRQVGLFTVTNIVVANIIGAGIFTTTGFIMGYIRNPLLMIILWVVGGIIAFFGALSYGELGAAFPKAGGEYYFITRQFHPLLGFLSGWSSLIVGFSAPIAASAIGATEYFTLVWPVLDSNFLSSVGIGPVLFKKFLAVFIILVFTIIHSRGLVFGAKIQNILTVMKVFLIIMIIFVGLSFGKGSYSNLVNFESFDFSFSGWKSIGLSLMFVMFAYSGWSASTYIGSEIKSPRKNIPRSLLISSGIVMVLYILLNLFFIFAIPVDEMQGVPEIGGLAARKALGETAQMIFSLFIGFALFSSLSAFIILGPRIYYSMAKQGYFFSIAAKVHPKYRVPVTAIVLQSIIAVVLVLSGTFEQILVYMGFSLGIFPVIAVFGVFKLRRTGKSKVKLWGYPYVQIVFIIVGILMHLFAFLERPVESSIAILTLLAGIPFYYWFKKKNFD